MPSNSVIFAHAGPRIKVRGPNFSRISLVVSRVGCAYLGVSAMLCVAPHIIYCFVAVADSRVQSPVIAGVLQQNAVGGAIASRDSA
jgi:hypothetical protein